MQEKSIASVAVVELSAFASTPNSPKAKQYQKTKPSGLDQQRVGLASFSSLHFTHQIAQRDVKSSSQRQRSSRSAADCAARLGVAPFAILGPLLRANAMERVAAMGRSSRTREP